MSAFKSGPDDGRFTTASTIRLVHTMLRARELEIELLSSSALWMADFHEQMAFFVRRTIFGLGVARAAEEKILAVKAFVESAFHRPHLTV